MSGDGAAAQPSLLRKQAALVGKGSLSSFDHFHVKGSAAATVAKKEATRALAAKDNTLAGVPRGFPRAFSASPFLVAIRGIADMPSERSKGRR